jgi:hypothetical protein
VYVLVRRDLTLEQQAVQACHAAFEAGFQFGRPADAPSPNLVFLGVRDREYLLEMQMRLEYAGIPIAVFTEEDDGVGETALATAPLVGVDRRYFRKLTKWEAVS